MHIWSTKSNNFAHGTCNKMIDYPEQNKLCLSEVDSDSHQDLKSNLTGFLILFVNHTITNFNISVSFLQNQVNSGKLDRDIKDICLRLVLEIFN